MKRGVGSEKGSPGVYKIIGKLFTKNLKSEKRQTLWLIEVQEIRAIDWSKKLLKLQY